MSRQWLRRLSLIVGDASGKGLDLGTFKVRFTIRKGDVPTPNTLRARVYNLAPGTAALIAKEFKQVTMKVAYKDSPFTIIYRGEIKQVRNGRENQVDTYTDITAATGDRAYNFGTVNVTVAAGNTLADVYTEVGKAYEQYGVTMAPPPDELKNIAMPRGRTLYGMARDVMRELAQTANMTWSIQDNKLQLVPYNKPLAGVSTIVLNPSTGLIGMPDQTEDAIYGKCLLNPQLIVAGRVKIDQGSIKPMEQSLKVTAAPNPRTIATDGLYRVLAVDHRGDTRAQFWYTEFACLALGDAGGTSATAVNLAGG